jgi:hypothetical protein
MRLGTQMISLMPVEITNVQIARPSFQLKRTVICIIGPGSVLEVLPQPLLCIGMSASQEAIELIRNTSLSTDNTVASSAQSVT